MWDGLPDFPTGLRTFSLRGQATEEIERDGLRYFVNEYWTAGQRQAHSLHEVSYRACFKPQLPEFFIARLTAPGETVYDPFSGRGTTALQAALMGRRPAANDINPLSAILTEPRLDPPPLPDVAKRLAALRLDTAAAVQDHDLLTFFHRSTLGQIVALRDYLLDRAGSGTLDTRRSIDVPLTTSVITRLPHCHLSVPSAVQALPTPFRLRLLKSPKDEGAMP